jgi:hypothetical protein
MSSQGQAQLAVSPEPILQLGLGFLASKTMLSAIDLDLFTELAQGPLTADQIRERLGLHPRSVRDFLDALVSLNILEREDGRYSNTPAAAQYLDRGKPAYVGGILEMADARLYRFWGSLTEALRTGVQQNESKGGGASPFVAIYSDQARLRGFLAAMTGLSAGPARAIAEKFPWSDYRTFADIGTAQGCVPVQVAAAHPHLASIGYDLPEVRPVFEEYVAAAGLQDRVRFQPGDFFREPLPQAEVLIMGHILHDWGLDDKRMLVRKAYDALPKNGAFVAYDCVIDDQRRSNTFGLLMSLNMLIETPAGFDYTGAECREWMREAGFRKTWAEHLVGPESMVVGIK